MVPDMQHPLPEMRHNPQAQGSRDPRNSLFCRGNLRERVGRMRAHWLRVSASARSCSVGFFFL